MATATDRLSLVFSALADPTRRAILARLADGPAAVTELAAPFQMSLPAVSKHLKVLERAGLIARGRQAQWRPCRIEPAPFRDVVNWLDAYRQLWDERFDRLDAYLTTLTVQATPTAPTQAAPPTQASPRSQEEYQPDDHTPQRPR